MTKYNHYAKELDEAFKNARETYCKVYEEYIEAKRALDDVPNIRGIIPYETAERRAKAEYNFKTVSAKFDDVKRSAWSNFYGIRENLRRNLEAELKQDSLVNPDSVDNSAIELLKSGIMSVDDFCALADKFDENPTMLKLIAKYAKEASKDENIAPAERGKMGAIYNNLKTGNSKTMRAWEELSSVSDYCSNVRHPNEYSHTVNMSKAWEQCSQDAIENF